MESFSIKTKERETIVDITSEVNSALSRMNATDGICVVYVPHTTAGITINENADPSVKTDIRDTLMKLVPSGSHYKHLEGNADSHVKSSMMGSSVTVIIRRNMLCLGTWQGIQFCEFDGPRTRQVWVNFIG